jgi:hypothetical protein
MNLISEGDWCSIKLNNLGGKNSPQRKSRVIELTETTNIRMLPQIGKGDGFNGDHFFRSPTYQTGISRETVPLYRKYGE